MSSGAEHRRGAVAGVVLASGMSRRFAGSNKLLAPVEGVTVVRRTVRPYLEAGLEPVIVVLGYEAEKVAPELSDLPLQTVYNPAFEQGQSRALWCAVAALPERSAAVIGVGDQPLLTSAVIRDLLAVYGRTNAPLVVPRYAGQRGNPVLFDRRLFAELLQVEGDQGGRPVLARHGAEIAWVDFADPRLGADIDTLEDYMRLVDDLHRETDRQIP